MRKPFLPFGVLVLYVATSMTIQAQEKTYTNSIGMQFVLIQPGSMIVGKFQPTINHPVAARFNGTGGLPPAQGGRGAAPHIPLPDRYYASAEEMAKRDAMPGFEVKLDMPYYIGIYEVTQKQYQKVMGINPSVFQGTKVADDASQHPVENVTWQDCQAFIKKLNQLEKGKARYRLPSEFEWEYAARAGATDDIPWADIRVSAVIAERTTAPVGTKKPNAWGVYDTLGNVWEWVQDVYNEKIFADPAPPKSGKEHVLKGAPFYGDVKNATYLTHAAGPGSKYDTGFRIVMDVKK